MRFKSYMVCCDSVVDKEKFDLFFIWKINYDFSMFDARISDNEYVRFFKNHTSQRALENKEQNLSFTCCFTM